jgi:hypothetical protein
MNRQNPGTHQKALQINIDAAKYGTLAEIGAGQEVARWFFQVGGAAGTVAKTISAYDMSVSDAIYGPSDRYVSRKRLQRMLDYEFNLLLERLDKTRGDKNTFFVFADTVTARSFSRHEDGQGWMGIRFQTEFHGPPSEIIIHVRMLDTENVREQQALGVVGVNLIYAAFFYRNDPATVINSLLDDLSRDRIEIDMIKFSGPAFAPVDNRLMALQLVQQGMSDAAMFTVDGEVVQPSEVLYKKPVLIQRGSFRPVTNVTQDMLHSALAQVRRDPALQGDMVVLMEMTLKNLQAEGAIDHQDFLARVDILSSLGQMVMVSNYARFHRVTTYLRQYTQNLIGMVVGVPTLHEIFEEKYYTDLDGGTLEALGRLFRGAVKLYVYPMKNIATGELITAETLKVSSQMRYLYAHLLENEFIEPIQEYKAADLTIFPRDVLALIRAGDPKWETMVPQRVVQTIKDRKLFGYQSKAQ